MAGVKSVLIVLMVLLSFPLSSVTAPSEVLMGQGEACKQKLLNSSDVCHSDTCRMEKRILFTVLLVLLFKPQ